MRNTHRRRVEPGVIPSTRERAAVPTLWCRLLEGAHPWGSFHAAVSQYGVLRYWLTIYPPGISVTDRRLARLWRGWPLSGAVLGLLAVVLLGNVAASPGTVLTFALAAYASIGLLLALRAGPGRVPVRSISIILIPGTADEDERRKFSEWQSLVNQLTRADHMLATGSISLVEHEAIWWETYDRLGPAHV